MIYVRVLGTAEICAGEHRITPDSTMLFALALFLSVTAGQRVQRSRLLDLFWSDDLDGSRRHALRQLLYRLRRDGFDLRINGEELFVDEEDVDSDVRCILASRWPEEATASEVKAAASLLPEYDPTLPELYREWLDELRARVSSQYRRALLRQIDAARREGRWYDVDMWAQRCLDIDPLNEEATLALAEAVGMGGSKLKALQIIDSYLRELGDQRRVIGLPAIVLRRRVSENVLERAHDEGASAPLIGRQREIARLNDVLRGTLSGVGAAMLIVGAPGIGKSRLARELLTSGAMRGWCVLSVSLHSSDGQRPLGMLIDLFAALLKQPGALGCAPTSLTQLRILTEYGTGNHVEVKQSQEAEAVQERLRRAATDLLESVASEGPLVLLIDDLHWCDDASSRLLLHLISRSDSLPLLWIFTSRREGRYTELQEAFSSDRVETMSLAPLAPIDAATLFELLGMPSEAGRSSDTSELADAVTCGNPLFIEELARHVKETGQATSLPDSLRSLIRGRASRLSPVARNVLHTCAILGRQSTVPRVASVVEISTAALLGCLDELDALGIVGTSRDVGVLSLHDLWRDELLLELLPASRRLLHHKCGLVLERECRASHAPSIAWDAAQHLLASGSGDRALGLLEECAQHQMDNGLPADAAKTLELAFQISKTDVDRLRTLSSRIAALQRAADWLQIDTLVGSAIELTEQIGLRSSSHSDLELLQIEVMWRTEADPEASLARSLVCARDESAPPSHRARAALLSAIVADNTCSFLDLERLNGIAESLYASIPSDRASLLSVRLIYETVRGSIERAQNLGINLVLLEREDGSVRGLARALRFASYPLRMLGMYREALASLTEALELAEEHSLAGDAASAADTILSIHIEREDLQATDVWIARCEILATRVNARFARASIVLNQAIRALLLGKPDHAMLLIAPYAQNHLKDPVVRQRILYLSILARVFVAKMDRARLTELMPPLFTALDLRRSTGSYDFHVASYAHALGALGDANAARDYVRNFVTGARRGECPLSNELQYFLE